MLFLKIYILKINCYIYIYSYVYVYGYSYVVNYSLIIVSIIKHIDIELISFKQILHCTKII